MWSGCSNVISEFSANAQHCVDFWRGWGEPSAIYSLCTEKMDTVPAPIKDVACIKKSLFEPAPMMHFT